MMTQPILSCALLLAAVACGGGGGGAPTGMAQPPAGSGTLAIDMTGTWVISNARIIETNDATALPPVDGTPIALSASGVDRINHASVSLSALESDCACALDYYINQCDGRTFVFGFRLTSPAGDGFLEVGLGGGVMDATTIATEAYLCVKLSAAHPELFVRSRYELVRTSPLVVLESTAPTLSESREVRVRDRLLRAFGLGHLAIE